MCPLYPLHILLLYVLILCPLWFLSFQAAGVAADALPSCDVSFQPAEISKLVVGESREVTFTFNKTEILGIAEQFGFLPVTELNFIATDPFIAVPGPDNVSISEAQPTGDGREQVKFNVTGSFLGYTNVCAVAPISTNGTEFQEYKCMPVSVIRKAGLIDMLFTISVAALVSIIYVNMGAALDLGTIKETMRRPWGPLIGFFSQFGIMPVLSYGIAKLLIPLAPLQLGLFITGCSPGGGASNIWTLVLGGNLDLSVTMTTISTFSAFAMMPLWILTLGSGIFEDANLTIPYSKIATFAISLVVPLAIGICIKIWWPKLAKILVRALKPFAAFLIVFIVIFAVYTNVYLFQLFTFEILLAGMLLPWLGYFLGGGTAYLLKQEWRDIIAIGIETGVQNTGLAIFALRFSLPQPEADLCTAMPVAVAIMTPIIPGLIILYQKYCSKGSQLAHSGQKEALTQGGQRVDAQLQQSNPLLKNGVIKV